MSDALPHIDQETVDVVKNLGTYEAGFETDIEMEYAPKGINEDIIRLISKRKKSQNGCWNYA